jgi:GrpB-like predicted nucleotidyltransferase (UPF0157 family)
MENIVDVKNYNPQWKNWFKRIRDQFWPRLGYLVIDVIHIGSTSVEGMVGKPIIDVDIVVENFDKFEELKAEMEVIGYSHRGNLGITDRESFVFKYTPEIAQSVYVIKEDSVAYRNHLLLKKHLEENKSDHERYKVFKQKLSQKVKSRDEYCQKKTKLILEFLEIQGMSNDEIELIRSENL